MNRRQKIIVSVTGIFLVLLLLVGLTYAYFLTRIQGNKNPSSITVTTAFLSLIYDDETSDLITSDKPVMPGFMDTKKFTVTNDGTGRVSDYAVILENYGIKYVNDATFTNSAGEEVTVYKDQSTDMNYNDLEVLISCKSYINYGKENQAVSGTCGEMVSNLPVKEGAYKISDYKVAGLDYIEGIMPEKSDILLNNSIDVGITHEYEITLLYAESNQDQSDDMNKYISGKINIMDPKGTVDITGTLAEGTYTVGDFAQINSEKKLSPIYPDGTYKFMGVKPDTHTLSVRYIDSSNNEQIRGTATNTISIVKGATAGTSGNTITITDATRTATVNISASYVPTLGTLTSTSTLARVLSVGDYINFEYTPSNYTTPTVASGKSVDTETQTFSSHENGNAEITTWRVLSTSNGVVKLIGHRPNMLLSNGTEGNLTMFGINGFNNGVEVLNDMVETLYSSPYGTARSMKSSDINEVVGYNGQTSYRGASGNVNIPAGTNKTIGTLETEASRSWSGGLYGPTGATLTASEISNIAIDYYGFGCDSTSEGNVTKPARYNTTEWDLIAGKMMTEWNQAAYQANRYYYWLADQAFDVTFKEGGDVIKYGIRGIMAASIGRRHLYNTDGEEQDVDDKPSMAVVPVIELSSSVTATSAGTNGNYKVWNLNI